MNPEVEYKLSVIRGAHPTWDFNQSFQYLMAQEKHTGTFGRPAKSADAVLIAEAKDGESETDAARAKVQAQHRDWTPEQCEAFLWETVWT